MRTIAISVAAGLVSALLIAAGARANALAILLFLLAPLPILIVSLGWTHRAGLIAAAAGAGALALPVGGLAALGFLAWTGLPAWWLAYVALLGRPGADGAVEWYPIGRVLAWVAATATLALAAVVLISAGSFEAFQTQARDAAEAVLRAQTRTPRPEPLPEIGGRPAEAVAERFVAVAPLFVGQSFAFILAFHLWAAAKIVHLSGRLPRPWPHLPATTMPRAVLGVAALGLGLLALGGFPGVLGLALLGALMAVFTLQGLALAHQRSARLRSRLAFLAGLYGLIVISQGAILIPVAIVGLADVAFGLRGAEAPTPSPPNI